jgi:hypothetical protein
MIAARAGAAVALLVGFSVLVVMLLEAAAGDVRRVLPLLREGRAPRDAATPDAVCGLVAVTLDAGTATWRHSWTGPPQLVDMAGDPVPFDDAGLVSMPARALDPDLSTR